MITKEKPFYELKYDMMFKTVVANPHDTRLLNKILTDALEEEAEVVEFYPLDLDIRNKKERKKSVDLLVRTKNGDKIHVEVNIGNDKEKTLRNLSYYTSFYSQVTEKSEMYTEDNKVLHVSLNFDGKKKGAKKEVYQIRDENGKILTNTFKFIMLNIAAYKNEWYNTNNEAHKYLVMLDANKEEIEELGKNDEIIKEFGERMFVLNSDNKFVNTISEEEDKEKLYRSRLYSSTKESYNKGEKEKALSIAKELIKNNVDISIIEKSTGLSTKEIEKLSK